MKSHPRSKILLLLAFILVLLASLACSIDLFAEDNEDLGIQQTLVSLQQTQAAINEQLSQEEQSSPGDVTEETTTEEVTSQEPDVIFEGISFSFDSSITEDVFPSILPAQNMGEEFMPSETYPTHYVFDFNLYAVGEHFHSPKILIYPVDEYRAMSEFAANKIDNLKQTLISQPGGGAMSDLPFLPMWNAAQIFSAKVTYFEFQNGSGVRYLTMYGQALYPVDNQNLFYTYQGLTDDGEYYLCAVLPVTHPGLPEEGQVDDWLAFEENWESYIADTISWLNAQVDQSFTPSIAMLDAMMASFEINR